MKQTEIDQLEAMYLHYDSKCFVCGNQATQRAHIIGNTKANRSKPTDDLVIDNILNWLPVCSLKCNSLVDIGTNMNAQLVGLVILSREPFDLKRDSIESIVRENITRKQGKS